MPVETVYYFCPKCGKQSSWVKSTQDAPYLCSCGCWFKLLEGKSSKEDK